MTDLDDDTLEHVYNHLRDDHPKAALEVADLILEESPHKWAKRHTAQFDDRVALVKALRSEYDMLLKEANQVVKDVWGEDDTTIEQ